MFLRARYYDPSTGRFLSRDSFPGYVSLPQSQNPYAYGLNNPILYTDPSGNTVPLPAEAWLEKVVGDAVRQILRELSCAPWEDWILYLGGAAWQYTDDMTLGLVSYLVGDLDYINYNSQAFQQGRNLGHAISAMHAALLVIIGTAEIEAAATAFPSTMASALPCEAVTEGACTAALAPALIAEGVLAVYGTIHIAWGVGVLNRVKMSANGGGGGWRGPKSPNQLNDEIRRGLAPDGIERVDTPKVPGEKFHVHFDDGSALNVEGTWKHGSRLLNRAQREWLIENGWTLP